MRTDVNSWVSTSKECRLWLLDRGARRRRSSNDAAYDWAHLQRRASLRQQGHLGALGAWQDDNGTQWVLAPFWGPEHPFQGSDRACPADSGGVAAFKLEQRGGNWQLTPAWLSRDMDLAEEAVIANGIVFTYAAGEDGTQVAQHGTSRGAVYGGGLSSGPVRRVPNSRRAALYALDGQTGKELWSSGNQIDSWNHFSGLTIANGRAHIATFDGVLYCFWNRQVSRRALMRAHGVGFVE